MRTIHYLSGPHINVEKGYWLYDQLEKDGFDIKPYYLYKYGHSRSFLTRVHHYTRSLKLLLSSKKKDLILLYDVTSAFILLGLFMKLLHIHRSVVAVNFMGSGSRSGYDKWKRPLVGMGLRNISRIGVNNATLIDFYSHQLHIDRNRFFIVKDCAENVDIIPRDCTIQKPPYVFMGGNVHRDWGMFKNIVREMPNLNFVAALGGNDLDDVLNLPNLKVYKNISFEKFNKLVAHCKIVFLPLKTEMQGGQLVAFQGSMYKKPVIITHCMSIGTYYDDSDVIMVRMGDKESCKNAILKLTKDSQLCETLGAKGYEKIAKLTSDSIYASIKKQFVDNEISK